MITKKRSGRFHRELRSKRASLPKIIFSGGVSASKTNAQGLDARYKNLDNNFQIWRFRFSRCRFSLTDFYPKFLVNLVSLLLLCIGLLCIVLHCLHGQMGVRIQVLLYVQQILEEQSFYLRKSSTELTSKNSACLLFMYLGCVCLCLLFCVVFWVLLLFCVWCCFFNFFNRKWLDTA